MPQKRSTRQSIFSLNQHSTCVAPFEAALRRGLEEDGWEWDWTTLGTLRAPDQKIRAKIIAKSHGVWAADALVEALMKVEPKIKAKALVANGTRLKPGMTVVEWSGPARQVLALERPFLNLASYVGGIATKTAGLVERIHEACPVKPPRLTATRKTLPGYRDLAIYGVIAGGGYSHRVSLSGGVLIKENHIAAAGGVVRAVEGVRAVAPHGLLIEIEVTNMRELEQAIAAEAGGVLLDNFSPDEIRKALNVIESSLHRPLVEVSGGINEDNIGDYAIEGVNILSSGSLTHSVKAIDLSLLITK
ncbi:MAG: carboxylating nicotinate-nucleotide diphosphorylase [Bdellovibrionia bacterium]